MKHSLRRVATLVAVPTLAMAALAATPSPAQAAQHDPKPVAAGADWLATQVTDGLVQGAYEDGGETFGYTDHGLSADIALALDAVGGHEANVEEIADALADQVEIWHSSFASPVDAGAVAKSLLVAQAAGISPTDFGGEDLVTKLEARIIDEPGATQGRLINDGSNYGGDFRSAISQALAVQGLDALGTPSTETGAATEFLLEQQCDDGWFRQTLSPLDSPTQACATDVAATPDTDATAIAVTALQSQLDDTGVAAAVADAVAWLEDQQLADGSFGGGTATEAPNANSTGLAATALAAAGETAAAEKAAGWIRAHQLTNLGACAAYGAADTGAVAYNDTDRAKAAASDIAILTADPYRRASAQAVPALRWAPAGTYATEPVSTSGFVKAGTKKTLNADAVAPGEAVCFAGGGTQTLVQADATGHAQTTVTLPKGTANRVYTVTTGQGVLGAVTVRVLDAKRLRLSPAKKQVAKGAKVKVKVTGLAAGEKVKVNVKGTRVDAGKASAKGVFTAVFRATGKPGKRTVKAVGELATRTGTTTVKVTR